MCQTQSVATDSSRIAREARVTWVGTMTGGRGRLSEAPGPELSWPRRAAAAQPQQAATTSPEHLIAAAHAGCYSMSLALVLERAGRRAEQLEVQARCIASLGEGGLAITTIELVVRATVPGLEHAEFAAMVDEAERACPVSNSLRGNVEIRVDAALDAPAA